MEEHGRAAADQLRKQLKPGERANVVDIREARAAQRRATAVEEAVTAQPAVPMPRTLVDDDDDYIPIPRI